MFSQELKKAISVPIADKEIKGEVKIQFVDNGSIWLYVLLGSPAAFGLVASIAWAAAVVFKKMQEGLAFREYVKNLKLKNEQAEVFLEAQKVQISALIASQAQEIVSSGFAEPDPERTERIKLAIGTVADLMNKGFEVHPSILAPEGSRNLFPDYKMLKLPSFSSKQIASPDENTEHTSE